MTDSVIHPDVAANVALTGRITAWLKAAGVKRSDMAVDIADIIFAARNVAALVEKMIELNPQDSDEADRAGEYLGMMQAALFTEMKHHLKDLEDAWPELEDRLEELSHAETDADL
jgi:hypothetical protein